MNSGDLSWCPKCVATEVDKSFIMWQLPRVPAVVVVMRGRTQSNMHYGSWPVNAPQLLFYAPKLGFVCLACLLAISLSLHCLQLNGFKRKGADHLGLLKNQQHTEPPLYAILLSALWPAVIKGSRQEQDNMGIIGLFTVSITSRSDTFF